MNISGIWQANEVLSGRKPFADGKPMTKFDFVLAEEAKREKKDPFRMPGFLRDAMEREKK